MNHDYVAPVQVSDGPNCLYCVFGGGYMQSLIHHNVSEVIVCVCVLCVHVCVHVHQLITTPCTDGGHNILQKFGRGCLTVLVFLALTQDAHTFAYESALVIFLCLSVFIQYI